MTTKTNGLYLYYRTRRQDVLEARAEDMKRNAYVEGRGQAFADAFGAVPLFTRGFVAHLAGITFTNDKPCKEPELWTKKTPEAVLQRPLQINNKHKRRDERLVALNAKWMELQPLDVMRPQDSAVLSALGVAPERIMEEQASMSFYLRKVDDLPTVYIAATMVLDGMDEVLGSEYLAATNLPPMELLP